MADERAISKVFHPTWVEYKISTVEFLIKTLGNELNFIFVIFC